MLSYLKENLFNTQADMIAHGVNCMGAFDAGVARQIRRLFPSAYEAYIHKWKNTGWKLGDVQFVNTPDTILIANCATQKGYGYPSQTSIFVDYKAVASVFITLARYSEIHKVSVAMPKIGAGLAGGDWDKINGFLEEAVKQYPQANITVYYLG